MIAQSDGQVVWAKAKPGDEVKAGDVVVNVIDNQLEREIELADIEVQERKAQLGYLKRRHTDELDKLRGFANVEMKNVKQSKVDLDGLQEQLALAQQQYDRLKGLADKGFATESKLDEARKQVILLKSQLENRRIELASRVELADQNIGQRLYNGINLVGEANEIEDKVRLAEHEIQLAEKKAQAITKQRQRASVTAPFDGTLRDLPRIDKGSVRKGDTIAVIEQRRNRSVTAFLNQDEILKVGLGDEALLYVPALGETLKGRVREIDRTSGFIAEQAARQLPGYQWRGAHDRSAKIMIEFEEPEKVKDADKYRAGLPVVVVFEQRSTNSLLSTFKKKFSVAM